MSDRAVSFPVAAVAVASCALGGLVAAGGGGPLLAVLVPLPALLLVVFAVHSLRHSRLSRHLRRRSVARELQGMRVRVGAFDRAAFVAGLGRPEIFCDQELESELTGEELRAVTLHERAHQLSRDPLRMTVLAVAAPIVRLFPTGRGLLVGLAADREIAADRFAMRHGASPSAIASAVLKVAPGGPVHAAAFSPATELRLRALVGEQVVPGPRLRLVGPLTWGALLGASLCVVALHPFMP
jgi:hypothetical protein